MDLIFLSHRRMMAVHLSARRQGSRSRSRELRNMGKEAEPKTYLYLIRHAATEANLARPARLQGRRHNPPLARLGIRQAEATRDFLAARTITTCYCSPMLRAVQ